MLRHRVLCAAASFVACLLGPAAASACAGAGSSPTSATLSRAARATACLINGLRARHGLAPLHPVPALERAAESHTLDMIDHGFFSHTDPTGTTPMQRIKRAGYRRRAGTPLTVGETIAWGSGPLGTPVAVVRSWMQSAPHRATLLDPRFRELGVGVALGAPGVGSGGTTVTADLAARR